MEVIAKYPRGQSKHRLNKLSQTRAITEVGSSLPKNRSLLCYQNAEIRIQNRLLMYGLLQSTTQLLKYE